MVTKQYNFLSCRKFYRMTAGQPIQVIPQNFVLLLEVSVAGQRFSFCFRTIEKLGEFFCVIFESQNISRSFVLQ